MQDPEPCCRFLPASTDDKAMDDIHAQVQQAYYNRAQWTTQDHRLDAEWSALMTAYQVHSFPRSVAYWPAWDSTVVFRDDYCTAILGTQRTALDIPELRAHRVDIVVTLNASSYFKESYGKIMYQAEGISNLRYRLSDVRISRNDQGFHEIVGDLARQWIKMMDDIEAQECSRTRPIVILFHCFAGINRSTSALCAFLIVRYHLTAQQAIAILLSARPGQRYWQDRDQFPLALHWLSRECKKSVLGFLCSACGDSFRANLKKSHQTWTNLKSEVSSCQKCTSSGQNRIKGPQQETLPTFMNIPATQILPSASCRRGHLKLLEYHVNTPQPRLETMLFIAAGDDDQTDLDHPAPDISSQIGLPAAARTSEVPSCSLSASQAMSSGDRSHPPPRHRAREDKTSKRRHSRGARQSDAAEERALTEADLDSDASSLRDEDDPVESISRNSSRRTSRPPARHMAPGGPPPPTPVSAKAMSPAAGWRFRRCTNQQAPRHRPRLTNLPLHWLRPHQD